MREADRVINDDDKSNLRERLLLDASAAVESTGLPATLSRRALIAGGAGVASLLTLQPFGDAVPAAHAAPVWHHPFATYCAYGDGFLAPRENGRTHHALDFSNAPTGPGAAGKPVYAIAQGIVLNQIGIGLGPYAIVVDHGGGWRSIYGHMESTSVSPGQEVGPWMAVGTVGGRTGYAPHLHLAVLYNGSPVDPKPLVQAPAPLALSTLPPTAQVPPSEEDDDLRVIYQVSRGFAVLTAGSEPQLIPETADGLARVSCILGVPNNAVLGVTIPTGVFRHDHGYLWDVEIREAKWRALANRQALIADMIAAGLIATPAQV